MNDIPEDNTETNDLGFRAVPSVAVAVSVKSSLSQFFLFAAEQGANNCKEAENLHKKGLIITPELNKKLDTNALIAIIFSNIFLESYIDSFIAYEKCDEKIFRYTIDKKIGYILNKSNIDAQIMNDELDYLLCLRNYFIHYNPKSIKHPFNEELRSYNEQIEGYKMQPKKYKTSVPACLAIENKHIVIYSKIESRVFNDPRDKSYGFPHRLLCYDSAQWAINTVIDRAKYLTSLFNKENPKYFDDVLASIKNT